MSYHSLLPNPTLHPQNTSIYCHIILYDPIQHYIYKTLLFIVILFITQSNITSTKHFYLLSYYSLLPNPTSHPQNTSIYCHFIYYPIQHRIHKTLLFIVILFITQSNITSTKHFYLLSYYSLLPNPTSHPQNTYIYCHIILYDPIQHHIHKTLLFIVILFITQSNIASTKHFYLLSFYLLPNPTLHLQNTSIYCHIILYYPIQHRIHKILIFIVISFFMTQSNITSTKHFYLLSYHSLLPNPTSHPQDTYIYCHIILC